MNPPEISIIIPCLRESENLNRLIPYLMDTAANAESFQIIVVLAPGDESIPLLCEKYGVIEIQADRAQRARQMNLGAASAETEILFFLHADTLPPQRFDQTVLYAKDHCDYGCFRLKFDLNHPILSFYSFFSRFGSTFLHGGDASLFVDAELFRMAEGFNEDMDVMEDYELLGRLRRKGRFKVLEKSVTTSARKYQKNGIIKLQLHYAVIQLMYHLGADQNRLKNYIAKWIKS